ncbi:hypothetical protein [Methyloceanibacter marginalis]|nr:hypothetical protein [Methyloceanibacter marginalis]
MDRFSSFSGVQTISMARLADSSGVKLAKESGVKAAAFLSSDPP